MFPHPEVTTPPPRHHVLTSLILHPTRPLSHVPTRPLSHVLTPPRIPVPLRTRPTFSQNLCFCIYKQVSTFLDFFSGQVGFFWKFTILYNFDCLFF